MWLDAPGITATGSRAWWQTTAPAGIAIVHAWIPYQQQAISDGANDHQLYGGGYYWQGGGSQFTDNQNTYNSPYFYSGYFGFQLVCGVSPGCNGTNSTPGTVNIENIELQGQEDTGPSISAPGVDNLWNASGWVRGTWPLAVEATDASGVCTMSLGINWSVLNGPSAVPNQSRWQQCPNPQTWSPTINTADYGDGPVPVVLSASNAAYDYSAHAPVSSSVSETINVDNQPVTLQLSGPTDAPSSAGTQYITASASAGPSGVSSIACSLDNAPAESFPAASATVPVHGLGVHSLSCTAFNGARDATGALGSSAPATWALSFRQPSVAVVSFSQIVGKLRCRRVRERVRIPTHWVTARHHGHRVRVKLPAETRTIKVIHCHARVVRRRERINGHWRIVRVVLLPHTVQKTVKRVRFGASTKVSGWLGTTDGNALGGQHVRILTAAANGLNHFNQAAVTTTLADGSWTAILPSGPSRLVDAVYDGAPTVEPTLSAPARLIVPASIRLRVHPGHTRWGHTITISGRLRGGFVPPSGEALSLEVSYNGRAIDVKHFRTDRGGTFRTTYTFLGGRGVARYPFWVTTIPESDYAFARASSRRVSVTVGPQRRRSVAAHASFEYAP